MINCCRILITFWIISSTATESHGGCFVHPTGITVSAGERVSLTCSTNKGYAISSWHLGKDVATKTTVYAAPVYNSDGTVGAPEILADGYNVSRPSGNETTLHINKVTLSQAGSYACSCNDHSRSTDTSTVVVLESEPKFSTDRRITNGEPVIFSCSISFNGSSDVSCELTIEDAFGYTVAGQTSVTVTNNLTICNVKHSIIANASSDQSYTCNVTLTTTKRVSIYSQVLKAVDEWPPISTAATSLTSDQQEKTSIATVHQLAIGLSVTIIFVAILVAIVVYFIIRSRKKESMVNRQHSEEQPSQQLSSCPQRPAKRYETDTIGSPIPKDIAPAEISHQAISRDKISLHGDEVILIDNELYSASPKQLDPSDGYLADEPVYNETTT